MKDELVLAYLAGVMDSDGFISIRRQATNSKFPNSETFGELIGVAQLTPEAIDLFKEYWGGSVALRQRPGNRRPIYVWTAANRIAATCLTDLRPYLRIKTRQADLALEIRRLKNLPVKEARTVNLGGRVRALNPEIITARIKAWTEIKEINQRGQRI